MDEENMIARTSLVLAAIGVLILFGLFILFMTDRNTLSEHTKRCRDLGMLIGGSAGAFLSWAFAFAIIAYEKAWDMFFGGFAMALLLSVLSLFSGKHSKRFQHIVIAAMMSIFIFCALLVSMGIRPPLDPEKLVQTLVVGVGVTFIAPLIGFVIGGFAIGISIAFLIAIISGKGK